MSKRCYPSLSLSLSTLHFFQEGHLFYFQDNSYYQDLNILQYNHQFTSGSLNVFYPIYDLLKQWYKLSSHEIFTQKHYSSQHTQGPITHVHQKSLVWELNRRHVEGIHTICYEPFHKQVCTSMIFLRKKSKQQPFEQHGSIFW